MWEFVKFLVGEGGILKLSRKKKKTKKHQKQAKSTVLTRAFEHESDSITTIIGLNGNNVVISRALEHLGHVVEVHPHGQVTVTAVVLEALRSEKKSHECQVAGIHGLERESGSGAVEVGVIDEVLDRFQNLLQ